MKDYFSSHYSSLFRFQNSHVCATFPCTRRNCVQCSGSQYVFLLANADGSSLEELLRAEVNFERVNYIPELQGEALCWDLTDFSYYCTSEKQDDGIFSGVQPLFKYQ